MTIGNLKRVKKLLSIITSILMLVQPILPALIVTPHVFAQETADTTPTDEQSITPSPSEQTDNTQTQITPTPESSIEIPTPTGIEPSNPPADITPSPTEVAQPVETGPPSNDQGEIGPDGASTTAPEDTSFTEQPTSEPSAQIPLPVEQVCATNDQQFSDTTNESWNIDLEKGTAETKGAVQLGIKYMFPQENNVSVTFSCLPKDEGLRTPLKIQKVNIGELNLPDDVKPYGEYAYDITTGMKDGDFTYDITLPKSANRAAEVVYMEDRGSEAKTLPENVTSQEGGTVKANDLTHFTIFIATYTSNSFSIEKSQYQQGETVYVKAGGLNTTKYYRMKINPPDASSFFIASCFNPSSGHTSFTGTYELPENATIHNGWKAELKQYSYASCTDNETEPAEDTFSVVAAPDPVKVTLCHSTESETNPYNEIEVNINSVSKCVDVNGHGNDDEDIIPPYTYGSCTYPGLNWDSEGEDLWDNHCLPPPPACGTQTWYTHKTSDFSDTQIIIDFSHDHERISVSAQPGYEIKEVWVDAIGDWIDGYYKYANGPLTNADPPGWYISKIKVLVERVCPPSTGSLQVNKLTDTDGDGEFETGYDTSNTLGFRWGIGVETPNRLMGQIASSLPTGNYDITENTVNGYHLTGWFYGNEDYGCNDPDGTGAPTGISVSIDTTTYITLCNARNTGTITVDKVTNPTGSLTEFPFSVVSTETGVNQSFVLSDGSTPWSMTLPTGVYTISEGTLPSGWSLDGLTCTSNQSSIPTGPASPTANFDLDTGETVTCTYTNTRETGNVTFLKHVDGGTALPSDWTFAAYDDGGGMLGDTYTSGNSYPIETGSYRIEESSIPSYVLSKAEGICTINPTNGAIEMSVTTRGGTCELTNTYTAHCGDGIKNQDVEQCDGTDGVTEGVNFCTNTCKRIPIYSGNATCSDGKIPVFQSELSTTVSSTQSNPITISLPDTTEYLFEASGDYGFGSVITMRRADAGYATDNSWINRRDDRLGIPSTAQYRGVTSLLSDMGTGNMGIVNWGTYNATHIYTLSYTPSIPETDVQFVISDWYDTWYAGDTASNTNKNQSGIQDNVGNIALNIYACKSPGAITGQKYEDKDADQIKEIGEPGLAGWTIFIDSNTNGVLDTGETSTVTDTNGQYIFEGVPGRDIRICEVQQTNWNTASRNACKTVNPVPGQTLTGVDFGNWKIGHIIISKNLEPDSASGWFDMYLDDRMYATINSDWTSGAIEVVAGISHTVREAGANGTNLSEFATHFSGDCNANGAITVGQGQTKHCTIVNTKIPVYTGDSSCPAETPVKKLVSSYSISATDTNGEILSGLAAGNYVFETSGTFVSSSGGGWKSDAAYSSNNNWASINTNYGIHGIAPNYGAHALLADLGSGVGVIDWGPYTATHQYSTYLSSPAAPQFVIGDRYSNWYGTAWDNQSGMNDNSGSLTLNVYACIPYGTIIVDKVTTPARDTQQFSFTLENGDSVTDTFSLADLTTPYTNATLPPGTYSLSETIPAFWTQTSATCTKNEETISPSEIEITGADTVRCTFTNQKHATIVSNKYEDSNNNGAYDPGSEHRLDGWLITLYNTSWNVVKSMYTGDDTTEVGNVETGHFTFKVPAGTYYVCETMKDGWKQTEPVSGPIHDEHYCRQVTVSAGQLKSGIPFGNTHLGNVHVTKYSDDNGDGERDEGEKLLAGWNMNLKQVGEYPTQTQMTDINGETVFADRVAGDYTLTETVTEGWRQTELRCGETRRGDDMADDMSDDSSDDTASQNGQFSLEGGQTVECVVGNQFINPDLTITKSNDTGGNDRTPGSFVTFTLTVTATQSAVTDVVVTDLPAGGFTYRAGSWTAMSTVRGDMKALAFTTEPTYASPGTWNLGTMQDGEVVTLTYIADISNAQYPGKYRDLAVAHGSDLLGKQVVSNDEETPQYFVGTDVIIVKNDQSGASVQVKHNEEGAVLGASTELPATGADARWLIIALIFLSVGGVSALAGWYIKRTYV